MTVSHAIRWPLFILGICVAQPGHAATICSPTIDATITPVGIPSNAAVYADGNPPLKAGMIKTQLNLQAILFSEGPPEQQAWLAPSASTATQNTWDFASAHDSNVWLSCRYSSSLLIASSLPTSANNCVVSTSVKGGPPSGPLCH